jgi:Yip1 domain
MNLQTRVINILTKPKQEWPVIASESTDVVTLYKEYIVLLAAIPAICGFLGMTVLGVTLPFVGPVGISMASAVTSLVSGYVLSLLGTYLAAVVIEKLAPTFHSSGGTTQALKMVAFSSTPIWVAGVLRLVPMLGTLTPLVVIYAMYLFYVGLPFVMKTPPDRVIPFMIISAIVIIVLSVVMTSVANVFTGVARLF